MKKMKRVYEIKRHEVKNVQVIFQFGRYDMCRESLELRIANAKSETEKLELELWLDRLVKKFNNAMREFLGTNNFLSVATRMFSDCLGVIEYGMEHTEAEGTIFKVARDEKGFYFEVEVDEEV